MNPMINEELLTLYYYDDGLTDDEKSSIAAALRSNISIASQYKSLCVQLDRWNEPDIEAPPAHLVPQLQETLARAVRAEHQSLTRSRPRLHFLSFFWGAGATAILVLGLGAGFYLSQYRHLDYPDIPTRNIPTGDILTGNIPTDPGFAAASSSFSRGLQSHLRDSQFELARLPVTSADDQTQLLMQIIEQNRLFERAAMQNDAQDVARVMRAFEPILIRLASGDVAPKDADALRAQLSFELKVMLTKISQPTSKDPQSI